MLIRNLTLDNFGLFRGHHEIDLKPRCKYGRERPVILVGGKNGAGKTTILEAVRLCLYGPLAFANRPSARGYEAYLRGRIHRDDDALVQLQSAAVGMEFEHAELGERHIYQVERSWEVAGNAVQSYLSVTRDGSPLDELDQANADDFLRDLIPPGVSQLYFFDGEKIQQLAETDSDDVALADAIRGLLGLDLVERLRSDLRIYANRLDNTPGTEPTKAELEQLSAAQSDLLEEQRELQRMLDECQARLDNDVSKTIRRLERRIAKEGGAFANQREKLKAEKAQLLETIESVEGEIRQLAEGLLPFTLAAPWCKKLREQLLVEEQLQGWRAHEKLLKQRVGEVRVNLDDTLFPEKSHTNEETRVQLIESVSGILEQLVLPPEDLPQAELIHKLSDDQRDRLLGAINRVLDDVPEQLKTVQLRLEKATRRLQEVETALDKVPAEEQVKPLLDQQNELNRDAGALESEIKRHAAEMASKDFQLKELKRKEAKLEAKLDCAEQGLGRRGMVAKVRGVLNEYDASLTTAKAKELSEAVASRFAQLWRKGDIVRRIEINPADFQVTLFDRHNRPVPKSQLSAGEKQIYAISMLWGLAQVSGRPLPMVIDTPLGRLDSDHRGHLVQRYFANASHQVIILSTDTEIDKEYFRDLSPEVSHAYHLHYDSSEASTTAEDGYFWSRRERELVHAD